MFLREIYLGNNDFGLDGTLAICDCIKYNKIIKLIDLKMNNLNYECAKLLAASIAENSTLNSLIVCYEIFILFCKKKISYVYVYIAG